MMTTSITKAMQRRASTPSNSSGLVDRIVGVRLELDRHADLSRFAVGHGQISLLSSCESTGSMENRLSSCKRHGHLRVVRGDRPRKAGRMHGP